MDEPEVVALADDGDDYVELYRHHYGRLIRALELAGAAPPTAEALAQEAFARTYRHWRRVREGLNPIGYPYRVAFRLLSRDRRGRRVDAAVSLPPGPASTEDIVAGRD